jgi:RHS repeat-associated protein
MISFQMEKRPMALADNGSLSLWLDDVQKQSLTFVDNDTRTLTDVRLGAQGVETGTRGTVYFDDFESRRFSYIGTLPDPGVNDPQATNQPGWFTRTYTYSTTIPHAVTDVTPETGSPDTYSYDANGNMTCRIENGVTYTHTYNAENRASSIAKRNGDCATGTILESWAFGYDGDGTRIAIAHFTGTSGTPDSWTMYFMGGAYELKDNVAKKYYSIAGMTVAVNDGTAVQYLLTDHLGSTVAVTNASGTLTSQQRYLPFGAARTIPNSPIAGTDFTYTGQRKLDDGMGGIMDYKARFYSPYINRFLSADTLIPNTINPQTWNRYSYAANNPILYNDPDGHCGPLCVIGLVGMFFIFNGTNDSYQPNLTPADEESRQTSLAIGISLLAIANPAVEIASNTIDCLSGTFCDPQLSALPGSATLYPKLDDIDAPRLSLWQRQQIDKLARENNCSITICGGFAETAAGIENRTIASQLAPLYTEIGPVPAWRNSGPPTGKDLDYWTIIGTDLPQPIKDGLTEIIGIPPKDNYNMSNIPHNLFNIPPGSLTFHGNGISTRKLAPWQRPYDWVKAE